LNTILKCNYFHALSVAFLGYNTIGLLCHQVYLESDINSNLILV